MDGNGVGAPELVKEEKAGLPVWLSGGSERKSDLL